MRGRAVGEMAGSGKSMGGLGLKEGEMKAVSSAGSRIGVGLRDRANEVDAGL